MMAVPSTDSISAAIASKRVSRSCSADAFGDVGSASKLAVSRRGKSPSQANTDPSSIFEVAPSLSMLMRHVLHLDDADDSLALGRLSALEGSADAASGIKGPRHAFWLDL